MTSGALPMTVRRICSIWEALKPPDPWGPARPPLKRYRNGAIEGGIRNGRLDTAALPADERGPHQVVRALFQHGYRGSRAADALPDILEPWAAQCRIAGGLDEEGAKSGEEDDALLERRELLGGEGRVHGQVRAHQGREISGRFHPAL